MGLASLMFAYRALNEKFNANVLLCSCAIFRRTPHVPILTLARVARGHQIANTLCCCEAHRILRFEWMQTNSVYFSWNLTTKLNMYMTNIQRERRTRPPNIRCIDLFIYCKCRVASCDVVFLSFGHGHVSIGVMAFGTCIPYRKREGIVYLLRYFCRRGFCGRSKMSCLSHRVSHPCATRDLR